MKRKLFLFAFLLSAAAVAVSQSVTVRFTARSNDGRYHPFDAVRVENVTNGWSQRVAYPDTVIVLGSSESINAAESNDVVKLKVFPNPFAGRTSTELQVGEDGDVRISVMRINGSVVSEYNSFMNAGIYRMNVSLLEPQVAFLCISTRSGSTVAKMVNTAAGVVDRIEVTHLADMPPQGKAVGIGTFNIGDQMSYKAVYVSSGEIISSNTITQAQTTSELVTLLFESAVPDMSLPSVTTSVVSDISGTSATCGGNVTSSGETSVTVRGVCWSTSPNPTTSNSHTTNGSGTGSFTSTLNNLELNTTYYVRAYATNSVGTAYGEERTFTTLTSLPSVTTSSVSDISGSYATSGGRVTSSGGTSVTVRGVCWSTSHDPTTAGSRTTNGSGIGSFTSTLSNLAAGTTYYVRAYATNSVGTAYGEERTFTTLTISLPSVTTSTVSDISGTSATCGGNVTSGGNGTVTARGVCWSTGHNPTVSGSHTTNGSGTGNFTSSITGLSSNTTYYVRAYATNSAGTAYGSEVSFTTSSNVTLPTVTTSSVSSITSTTATCGGNVTNSGNASVTARGVCWSTSHNPTISGSHTTNGSGTGSFTSSLTGLSANTTYYVRAYATNSAGTAYGSEVSFTTSSNVTLPTVTTSSVSNVTATTATCGGNVTSSGNASVTARGVCWSTSHNPTVSGSHTTNGSGTGSFTSNITGLSPNTTYYVRAYATNSAGTAYGSEMSFTTSCTVPTVTISVNSVTSSTATCSGNVTSDGGATVTTRGVCWSTSHNPTVSGSHTTDGSGTGTFTSSLTGLNENTTYYVRTYATNSVGTAYGSEKTFTTEDDGFDENGASNAVFTVAAGRTVKFSRGNLQYKTTGTHTVSGGGTATGTWRFAEHQCNKIGNANSNISSSYTGWIDLFGWGTSGWSSGATAYQPWATSQTYSHYYPGGSSYTSLTGSYARADWGVYNAISNGGNQPGMWRTLTKDEWMYLTYSRGVYGVTNTRYALATVCGVTGVIIFPDTFTMPAGLTVSNVNTASSALFSSNTYTRSQWDQLETAGCIFLPAAGYRNGTELIYVGSTGHYWSSTDYEGDGNGRCAYEWSYGNGQAGWVGVNRNYGCSVRLVMDN